MNPDDLLSTPDAVAPPLNMRRVSFAHGERLIIDGVDCTVSTGSLVALVGPNGAGKSTLLHLVAAIERAQAGDISLGGVDSRRMRRRDRARHTALVEQQTDTDLVLTVLDVVLLGRTPHIPVLDSPRGRDVEIAHRALQQADASGYAERQFHELSGGERQRVLLARALAQEPGLLLIDEPTNHLDVRAQLHTLALMRSLAADRIAVLAALHDLNLAARYADQVLMLDRGRVVASGSPGEVLTPERIERVYGVRADVVPHPDDGSPLIAFSALAVRTPVASDHGG